jgi:hypothetical protein
VAQTVEFKSNAWPEVIAFLKTTLSSERAPT